VSILIIKLHYLSKKKKKSTPLGGFNDKFFTLTEEKKNYISKQANNNEKVY
jgi:hypothetical protein